MILIIAGGRDYELTVYDYARLEKLRPLVTEVVSGGAPGTDAGGEFWAKQNGIPVKRFLADWKKHGKAAGPIRNREMAEYAHAAALFPGGKGTKSMRAEAVRAGIEIFEFAACRNCATLLGSLPVSERGWCDKCEEEWSKPCPKI